MIIIIITQHWAPTVTKDVRACVCVSVRVRVCVGEV